MISVDIELSYVYVNTIPADMFRYGAHDNPYFKIEAVNSNYDKIKKATITIKKESKKEVAVLVDTTTTDLINMPYIDTYVISSVIKYIQKGLYYKALVR